MVAEELLEAASVDIIDNDDVCFGGEKGGEDRAGRGEDATVAGVAPGVAVDAGDEDDVALLLVVVEARVLIDLKPTAAVLADLAVAAGLDVLLGAGARWIRDHRHVDVWTVLLGTSPGNKEKHF